MLQATHIFIQQLVNSQLFCAKSSYNLASKMTVFDFLFLNNWIYDTTLAPLIKTIKMDVLSLPSSLTFSSISFSSSFSNFAFWFILEKHTFCEGSDKGRPQQHPPGYQSIKSKIHKNANQWLLSIETRKKKRV